MVTLWLLSTDNLNRPPEQLEGLLGVIGDAVEALAEQRRWRIHPVGALDLLPAALATRLKEAEESTRDVDGHPGQRRRPVRRPARDRGRRTVAAPGARRARHQPRGAGRGDRRRPHRRAPLHQGPARPRPGDPYVRASSDSAASCCGRARRASSTSARPTGPTSARSTSCAPSGPTPSESVASAPDRRSVASSVRDSGHVLERVARNPRTTGVRFAASMGWGSPIESGGPFVRHHDQTARWSQPCGSAARSRPARSALRPSGSFPVRHAAGRTGPGVGCPRGLVRGVWCRRPSKGPDGPRVRPGRQSHGPHVRPRHQRAAGRPGRDAPVRRARGGPARRRDHRAGGETPPSRARLLRAHARCACSTSYG